MAYRIEEMISEEEVNRRIRELGEQITKDYEGRTVRLVCILRGAVFFMCELAKRIELPVRFDFMSVSSYGSGTSSSGIVRIIKDLEDPVTDEDVIIVEDIIDSGRTLSFLKELFKSRGAASIRVCTLLDKPSRRAPGIDIKVDYTGFQVPDKFVVGWGMDYDQRYRNLPYIGVITGLDEE
ncbi:MAG: hypoxanthine phosphoribosyltransferase [Lachnospiraceae bacterium]|jgi:hypoxanthine phosphoribosyltransferase|nr:hypoxanthine phosphoribosyltransferase [Lachnospiraceae bacterium]MEE1162367.1 hypoxanthine phosphoribosyltransferase [Lachnospiraceae bacterium]